jgi:tripartite-type tricarboxylate transporter receptor subunit TctC
MKSRLSVLLPAVCLAASLAATGCGSDAPYPSRPITMVVPWGAGGGTDAVARVIAAQLEQELGQPVNVVNRTGGSGVVGHQAIAAAAPDGYTIGMLTVEIAMMHHQGLTDLTPDSFTPLGLMNFDATGLQVRADSPYQTLGELLDAIRSSPAGTFKASGTAQGGIWHVSLYGMLDERGIQPSSVPWVPSVSSAAGLLDLVAGGVDIVTASHPEARSLIDAGRVKSLAVFDTERSELYPDVPTGREAVGSEWEMGVWRGIAAPLGLPDDVRTRLETALEAVYNSDAYREFMTSRGFGMRWAGPGDFAAFMAESDAQMGDVMRQVGLAQ